MYIHIAPVVLDHMDRVASTMAERGLNFKLREGLSAETSGEVTSSVPVFAVYNVVLYIHYTSFQRHSTMLM